MKSRPYIPLLAKVLGWLALHLTILVLAFVGFVSWQLELGLDSLLSGSAGERLKAFGDEARLEILDLRPPEWNAAIIPLAQERKVTAAIFSSVDPASYPVPIPMNVLERARTASPPLPGPPERRGPPREMSGGRSRGENLPEGARPPPFEGPTRLSRADSSNENNHLSSKPAFLMRGSQGDGYWAGVNLRLPSRFGLQPRHELLLIRTDGLDGSGMFFDFKPWLWGGLAVLSLSLVFWTPFVWSLTRYIRKLTSATDSISAGHFEISLPTRGNDELGNLGLAIQTMAGRLDHFVSGQKRFLGDAAHELCAPLARLRTGLSILEMKLGEADQDRLASIEADAQELATLIEELLAFSRASHRTPQRKSILLEPLVGEIANRESGEHPPKITIPSGLRLTADSTLLGRALGNLIRNARTHAGPDANIAIDVSENSDFVEIQVSDDGPGVAAEELPHLFEPFYRPDRSRSRETGGSGLGLAIVRTAMEACGGDAFASLPASGGFAATLRFRKGKA